ncbi:MAG: hypothetical protein HGA33_03700 [Candidatus Moranbacteria bacterium]|nr:hypothetical protein [Candidatus Moranbacteria bacterium]
MSHSPELGRLFQPQNDKADSGWLKNLFLAIFTDQEKAALEFYVSLMKQDDQEFIRHFIGRMKTRDVQDKGKRVGSLAMNLFLRKNPAETIEEVAQPAPAAQASGAKKGKPSNANGAASTPPIVKKTIRSPREDTPDDIRVKYLENVVERIKVKMSTSGRQSVGFTGTAITTQSMTRDAAIDAVIDEMEAGGFISTKSFEKDLGEIMKALKENEPVINEVIYRTVLGEEKFNEIGSDNRDRLKLACQEKLGVTASDRKKKREETKRDIWLTAMFGKPYAWVDRWANKKSEEEEDGNLKKFLIFSSSLFGRRRFVPILLTTILFFTLLVLFFKNW